jgi:hypothetical protein
MGEHYVRVQEPFWALGEPVDAAIARIHDRDWSAIEHDAEALPCGRLAMTHSPHENELLFVVGFSGQRSRFSPSLGTLFTRGTPYLTQEADVPGEWKAESTFALFYNSEGATSIDASTRGLPMAQGFSGSLVWDTKAVRCWHEGRTWDPDLAEVTGLVWGWPTSAACLLGTKIEHLKSFMLHALRREAAYFSWLSRGSPNGDDLTDWLIAVSEVPELC